jgi:hypothetical protein
MGRLYYEHIMLLDTATGDSWNHLQATDRRNGMVQDATFRVSRERGPTSRSRVRRPG